MQKSGVSKADMHGSKACVGELQDVANHNRSFAHVNHEVGHGQDWYEGKIDIRGLPDVVCYL